MMSPFIYKFKEILTLNNDMIVIFHDVSTYIV